MPNVADDAFWNYSWTHKLAMLGRQGVQADTRPLHYRNKRIKLPDSTEHTFLPMRNTRQRCFASLGMTMLVDPRSSASICGYIDHCFGHSDLYWLSDFEFRISSNEGKQP